MKNQYVENLTEGMEIRDVFRVASKSLNHSRNGKPYLSLTMADRTGEMEARVWEKADELTKLFAQQDFLAIEGNVNEYMGRLQMSVRRLARVDPETIDPGDFLPRTPRDIDAMWDELVRLCGEVENPHIKRLLELFFEDERFVRGYKTAPAAKGIHHVYIGGLLEHSLSLVKLSRLVASHYTSINGDMLVAIAVLHDAAKMDELTYDTGFDYSPVGRLVGHIALGIGWVEEKIRQIPDFPEETALHLKHLIASHHGDPAFGAIKSPMTPEAVVFHHLDNVDAKLWTYLAAIEKVEDEPGPFTPYHNVLQTFLYKGDAAGRGSNAYGYRFEGMDIEPPAEPAPKSKAKGAEAPNSLGLFDDPPKKR